MGWLVVGAGFNADHRERCRNDHSAEDVGNAVGHYSMCEVSAGFGAAPAGRVSGEAARLRSLVADADLGDAVEGDTQAPGGAG